MISANITVILQNVIVKGEDELNHNNNEIPVGINRFWILLPYTDTGPESGPLVYT